jgi:hypothetical protein
VVHVFSVVLFAVLWLFLLSFGWLTYKVIRRLESGTDDKDNFPQGL